MSPELKCTWCALLFTMIASAHTEKQPHIVFIMVDDMGWNDVSFHGSDQIQTPNIDALASAGVVLQQYYSEAICTPARSALLTGKYPMRMGMHGMPLYNSEDRGIPLTERLLPSYLKELGYATHLVGKWHVGMSRDEYLPTNRGYDSHYGMRGGFVDYYTYNKVESWPDGRLMFGLDLFDGFVAQDHEQRYIVDVLTQRAINIIDNHNASTPLFLHVTHNAPHAGNDGGALQPPLGHGVNNMHIANSDRRLYADVVSSLDRNIGELVKALAYKNILDNTIIVFASDNGAPTVGQFKNWGINLPFRGKKATPWEGGVRVPAFIWHSKIKPRVWQGLMHITDWLPTLAAAAGGIIDREIDGVSQWDALLRATDSPRREVLVAMDDTLNNTYAAYRAGDYKIIVGNVAGLSNGYYGAEMMMNKAPPPNYFDQLRLCEATKALGSLGWQLDKGKVDAMRQATVLRQVDLARDAKPCEPTLARGCLYNVRKDPSESHDLWSRANKIAKLLSSRVRALWAMQSRRGPTNLQLEADPQNFNFTWIPWIREIQEDDEEYIKNEDTRDSLRYRIGDPEGSENENVYFTYKGDREGGNTLANVVDCTDDGGIRHFLCVLRSVL